MTGKYGRPVLIGTAAIWFALLVSGCTPTVRVEAPKEPIEINLNVKIEHEIRIKVDKDLKDLFETEEDIF